MRYIDNGKGDPLDEAVFTWLRDALTPDVVGIRWQSGFFEAGVLGSLALTLAQLAAKDLDTMVLIGSNDCETGVSAVHKLVDLLGLPRSGGKLGIVSYADGFYHPKTIHIRYGDDREVAYVGSANLTSRGINGLNVEAGIVLDTDQGDAGEVLTAVKEAVAEWFESIPGGLYMIEGHGDVDNLERQGVLKEVSASGSSSVGSGVAGVDGLVRRGRRHALPSLPNLDDGKGGDSEREVEVEARLDGDVLVAELAGPGRWSQAAFPKWFIENFFEVQPGEDRLRLVPVIETGVRSADSVACGYKGSKNWYYELRLANSVGEYTRDPKPLGVFHRIAPQTCRYTIIMPGEEAYSDVSDCLAANLYRLNRPKNQLRRTIMPAQVLADAWADDWFFDL